MTRSGQLFVAEHVYAQSEKRRTFVSIPNHGLPGGKDAPYSALMSNPHVFVFSNNLLWAGCI